MDGMQAIFYKNKHPTQSHVKVHSMSILTGSYDQQVGKTGPLCYTLKFGDTGSGKRWG